MYLIQTYHDFFKRTKQNLYGSKKVDMPKPEFYVIFTGEKSKNPPDTISLLKDFFDGEKIAVDAEIKVLYQEDEGNIIGQYIIFCKVYNEQVLEAYAEDTKNSEARKTAEKLIRKGKMSLDEIADCIPALTFDELKKLEAEIMQLA